MKKRKNMYILAIVALILVLGVGYAVVSTVTLTISGSGAAATEDLKVVYDGVNTSSSAKVTTLTAEDNSTSATFVVENMVYGEEEYAEFEIKNKETDVNATVAVPTVTNNNTEYFEVQILFDDDDWDAAQPLDANDTAKVKAKVSLKKTPVEENKSSATITVSFTASPVSNNANH